MRPNREISTQRVLQEQAPREQLRVAMPIAPVQIQSTATTVYTAGDGSDFWVKRLYAADVAAGSSDLTLYLVEDGGSPGTSNEIINALSLSANAAPTLILEDMLLAPGTSIQALCSTNNDINIFGWGYDFFGEYG